MKICFFTPFKPLDHPQPSGDGVTAQGIYDFLERCGHDVTAVSSLRCRWIFWKPWLWPRLLWERRRVSRQFRAGRCDLWFSYHSYYKAPDLLGPTAARRIGAPYVLFQGIYSTKRRRDPRTLPGFHLNRRALMATQHVFANKKMDWRNLKRLLPEDRLTYVAPGIQPGEFTFDPKARSELRQSWHAGDDPVVLSVAMFRPGVKAEGLRRTISACGELLRRGRRFKLVVVGDGRKRADLERAAQAEAPGGVEFPGRIGRQELYRYYSAADLFVFPGIQESLGLVYLEAQSCGLPPVAFENAGVSEAIQNGQTGLLVPMHDSSRFIQAIDRLLLDPGLRRSLGERAKSYVRAFHDLEKNYGKMEEVLQRIARAG